MSKKIGFGESLAIEQGKLKEVSKALHPLEIFNIFGVAHVKGIWRRMRKHLFSMVRDSPGLKYMWVAVCRDGGMVYQYDLEGNPVSFKVVQEHEKKGNIVAFVLIPLDVTKPLHWVLLPPNGRVVYFRWVEQDMSVGATGVRVKRKSKRIMYVIGFQATIDGENRQWLHIVKADGSYRDANTFGLDWRG